MPLFKPFIHDTAPHKGGATRHENVKGVQGDKVIKLSSNENLLGSSPKALEAIQRNIFRLNEYAYHGDEPLRNALSEKFNNEVSAEQFITANSGMELLELIVRGFLDPGLEFIVSTPTFRAYRNFGTVQGAAMVNIPLTGADFDLDVKGILEAVNENTRIIFLSNPNNPTGRHIPISKTDNLIFNLPSHVITVYDEVYFHYVESKDFSTAARYVRQGKKVIGLNSFSKAYGLAGMRLGYAYSTLEVAAYLSKIRRPFMINTLTMEAGIAALQDEDHIRSTQKMNAEQKKWLYAQLELLNIHYWKSEANFIMFRSPAANDVFIPKMLEHGVMVRPCEGFDAPGCTRVTIGRHEDNDVFVRALRKVTDK
jgi:histidinol-phosphate aminotransferase